MLFFSPRSDQWERYPSVATMKSVYFFHLYFSFCFFFSFLLWLNVTFLWEGMCNTPENVLYYTLILFAFNIEFSLLWKVILFFFWNFPNVINCSSPSTIKGWWGSRPSVTPLKLVLTPTLPFSHDFWLISTSPSYLFILLWFYTWPIWFNLILYLSTTDQTHNTPLKLVLTPTLPFSHDFKLIPPLPFNVFIFSM